MEESKPINTLVIDAGPIIRNEPAVSTLLATSHRICTLPSVAQEIKDPAARSRFDVTLKPFLILRDPIPESVAFVQAFARRTGDLSVLSNTDLRLIALAYELELELNSGDWRLRSTPGQKRTNGPKPFTEPKEKNLPDQHGISSEVPPNDSSSNSEANASVMESNIVELPSGNEALDPVQNQTVTETVGDRATAEPTSLQTDDTKEDGNIQKEEPQSESDSEEWITPSNLSKHQAKDAGASTSPSTQPKTMQVATLTTDFAMQNVMLQINLNILSSSLHQIRHIKTHIKRCHACFLQVRDMDKQFCPRCGKDTLTKVSCSTNSNGEFQIHLKKNMQWNNRGNKFSVPKAVHGSANGRVDGGGQGGWGNKLILAEDQKEYVRAISQEKRTKQKDLMDEDFLPSILSGDRGRTGGRPKVGAGRNVNSKKRK